MTVDDDRLISSLRRIAEPVEPSAESLDRLYESLASELGFRGESAHAPVHWLGRRGRPGSRRVRVPLWFAAAVLLALAALGGVALVGAMLEDRTTNDPAQLAGNGLIAVGRDDGILLLDPTTGKTVTRLEPPLPSVTAITWAPDGKRLAFNVEVQFDVNPSADPRAGGVWVMDVSTGTSEQLLQCGSGPDACSVAWSPDGSRIAVTHGNLLELIDPATGRVTVLEDFRQLAFQPTWSPDSTRIAVSLQDAEFTAVDRDGTGRTTLSRRPDIGDASPIWSPDGSTFAYIAATEAQCPEASSADECAGQYDATIMLLRLATNSTETLGAGGRCRCVGVGSSLGWSPDGTRLVLVLPPLEGGPTADFGLFVMDVDGSDLRLLSDGYALSPAWQPVP
jgi:Tol biopolymer transport system component